MRSAAGRVLGLVLIAVALMSVVGLAASETFVNKTGKTVAGITITFSKWVTITRHDSVFPDQDPSRRSQEFTFSGRKLRNLGRFSVSWMPSSAKVTGYEWIEEEQEQQATPVQQDNAEEEFPLPDPNTHPTLYGDDYPGPDEPLYQPQEDEQIWLTDLDGHGDIYDNDSIKINYGPGFDKSQITEIDVYRNGIKLRFLPETFDVLTNAQMKTFDGNPAERSPASNHTDHAIMGYEYKFEIHTADHVWMLSKTVNSEFKWLPNDVWAEMAGNWTDALSELTYNDVVKYFKILKADGFTGIGFAVSYYMNTPYDSAIYALQTKDPKRVIYATRTPAYSEVETMLRAINEAGLDASVRSMIYISKQYQDEHGWSYQAFIDPSNAQLFFENHTQEMVTLALILEKYHVELFTVYTEMDILQRKYPYLIKKELDAISEAYSGELGIVESTNIMLTGHCLECNGKASFPRLAGKFWDWEDKAGRPIRIEYSCWAPPLDTQNDQRSSVMARNFVGFWKVARDYYHQRYPDTPQMFGEIGVFGVDGVCLGQAYSSISDKRFDDQETADIWYAYLRGIKELGISRMHIWQMALGDLGRNIFPGDIFINIGVRQSESPAYRVITSIIKPEE